jgi:hypothetical protein
MSAAQSHAFYREVAQTRRVWTVRDEGGYPAPVNSRGVRAQPIWSSRARAERIIKSVRSYRGFTPQELSWEEFRDKWLPELERDGFEVGVNWSGPDASGYDEPPARVREAVEWHIEHLSPAG